MKEKRQILRTMFPLPQPLKNMYILVNIVEHNVTVSLYGLQDYNLTHHSTSTYSCMHCKVHHSINVHRKCLALSQSNTVSYYY